MRAILDTSVLLGDHALPSDIETGISTVSLAELHFGLLAAANEIVRGNPRKRLADLAIAATAVAHSAILLTANSKDLTIVRDLVVCRKLTVSPRTP